MPRLKCECGKNVAYEPDQAGKKIRCPGCKKMLRIPDEEDEDEDEDEEEDAEEESDEKPAERKRKTGQPSGSLGNMGYIFFSGPGAVMILIVVFLGAGVLSYGIYESRVASGARQEPSTVTCAQVVSAGVPENAHVILKDFMIGVNYTYTVKMPKSEVEKVAQGGATKLPWESVYVPVVPWPAPPPENVPRITPALGKPPPSGGEIHLLLKSSDVRDVVELDKLLKGNKVQGLLAPSARKLDSQTAEEIRKLYPGIDLDKVLVLEEGRKPSSPAFTILMITLGTVLLILALSMGIIGFVNRPR